MLLLHHRQAQAEMEPQVRVVKAEVAVDQEEAHQVPAELEVRAVNQVVVEVAVVLPQTLIILALVELVVLVWSVSTLGKVKL